MSICAIKNDIDWSFPVAKFSDFSISHLVYKSTSTTRIGHFDVKPIFWCSLNYNRTVIFKQWCLARNNSWMWAGLSIFSYIYILIYNTKHLGSRHWKNIEPYVMSQFDKVSMEWFTIVCILIVGNKLREKFVKVNTCARRNISIKVALCIIVSLEFIFYQIWHSSCPMLEQCVIN